MYLAQEWLYGEGITLPVTLGYDLTLVNAAYDLAKRWDASRAIQDPSQAGFQPSDIDGLDSNQRGTSYDNSLHSRGDDDACSHILAAPGDRVQTPPVDTPVLPQLVVWVWCNPECRDPHRVLSPRTS